MFLILFAVFLLPIAFLWLEKGGAEFDREKETEQEREGRRETRRKKEKRRERRDEERRREGTEKKQLEQTDVHVLCTSAVSDLRWL